MMTAGRTYLRYPLGNGGTKEKKKNTDTRIEFFLSREWKSRKSREGEREEEGEKKRGMSRPEWGENRPTAEPKKTLETTGMHECTHHTLIRARPDPLWKEATRIRTGMIMYYVLFL